MSGKARFVVLFAAVALVASGIWWFVAQSESVSDARVEELEETVPGEPSETEVAEEVVAAKADAEEPDAAAKTAELLSQRVDLSDPKKRAALVAELEKINEEHTREIEKKAKSLGLEMRGVRPDGREFVLSGFEGDRPIYEYAENVRAAISTAAHLVRDTSPFNVNGSGETIGMWEVGLPRVTHEEFGRPSRLTMGQSTSGTSDHATHVAGTMIAAGVNASLKGMAPGAEIVAFTSTSDSSEMMANGAAVAGEAGKIYLSNHSYGFGAGWTDDEWEGTFVDDADTSNDFEAEFGRYGSNAISVDGLTYNLPYYLPFFSAGNHGNDNPPANGQTFTHGSSTYTYDSSRHPASDGVYKNGYDTCEGKKVAKNVMTVGAVNDAVTSNSRNLALATLASFSSTGPTDDGRIKPDIVANGVSLLSSAGSDDTSTASFSGTSMSSPNAAGSAVLLVNYYGSRFPGQAMRAATLKGLILHTADDRGNAGPDYQFGWGLMNTQAAANLIKDHADHVDDGGERIIEEQILSGGGAKVWSGVAMGGQPLRVTLCWTDPAGSNKSGHENRSRALVNDLNLTVQGPGGTHLPYVMPHVGDWSIGSLDDVATTGVNNVDNVEQVYLSSAASGSYTISVDYSGSLTHGLQDYSLIITGLSQPFVVNGADFQASGGESGPFSSSFEDYTLENQSSSTINWSATDDVAWLDLDVTSGSIAPQGSAVVRAELTAAAESLPIGIYQGEISVTHVGPGSVTVIPVRLEVQALASLPFLEDFEDNLDDYWELGGTSAGRGLVTSQHGPHAGNQHFTMDSTAGTSFSRTELTLTLDLTGLSDLELSFWAKEFSDELHSPPASPFVGGADFDGVAVSVDGTNWYAIMTYPSSFSSYQEFTIDLDAAIAAHGLAYNGQFKIRFSQYDNSSISVDGIALDDIRLTQSGPPEIEIEDGDQVDLVSGAALVDGGSVPVGSSGSPMNLTISNSGLGELTGLAVSKSGAQASDFVLSPLGVSSLAPGESAQFSVSFSPTGARARTAAIQVTSNDSDEGVFSIQLTGIGLHTQESWRQFYYQTTANAGNAADSADPNKDGVDNLMAFAVGLNPLESGIVPIDFQMDASELTIVYQRSRAGMAAGLVYEIEWTETLDSNWSTLEVVEEVLSDDGVLQQVESTLPRGIGKRFVRLSVTKP